MPRDGSGNYVRPFSYTADKNANIGISAERFDEHEDDVAAALSDMATKASVAVKADLSTVQAAIAALEAGAIAAPGSDKQIPFNDGGLVLAAMSGITWTKATGVLALTTAKLDLARCLAPSNTPGVVYKETNRFLHDFRYGSNGTATPDGRNLFLGLNAGNFTTGATATLASESSYNVGIGDESLNGVTTGYDNTALGYRTLYALTTGSRNVAIGRVALAALTTGDANVAVGTRALQTATTGSNNVALGHDAMAVATTAYESVAIGGNALLSVTTGNNNIAIGDNAGRAMTVSNGNIALGSEALRNTTSSQNVGIGRTALYSLTSGDGHVAIGYEASYYATGSQNTMLGYRAGKGASGQTAFRAVGVGYLAGTAMTTAEGLTAVGYLAGAAVTTGSANTLVGEFCGQYITTAQQNTALGANTMGAASATSATDSSFNVGLGNFALRVLQGATAPGGMRSSSGGNTAVGYEAGRTLTTGVENVYMGNQAGWHGTTASYNVQLGTKAGDYNDDGNANTFVGAIAGYLHAHGDHCVLVGYECGYGIDGGGITEYTMNYATCVGSQALNKTIGSDYNTAFGYRAGYNLSTGGSNLLIGPLTGATLTTGSDNLLIGKSVDAPASGTTSYGSIGNLLFFSGGWGTGTTVGSGNIGVKTKTPAGTLDIGGNVALERDADDTLALRRGTNAQLFRAYNTYTDATTNEFIRFGFSSNVGVVGTVKGSVGGTARALAFQTDGTSRWQIHATTGAFLCQTDGAYDIGSDGALRPNNLWVKSSILADTQVRVGSSGAIGFRSRTLMTSSADGIMSLRNAADSAFAELNLKNFHVFPGIATTWTPATNGELVVEAPSNTQLTFKLKGSDGTVRSGTLTLA